VPAAAVIPAPIAYIKVVAVKKLVVEFWNGREGGSEGFDPRGFASPFVRRRSAPKGEHWSARSLLPDARSCSSLSGSILPRVDSPSSFLRKGGRRGDRSVKRTGPSGRSGFRRGRKVFSTGGFLSPSFFPFSTGSVRSSGSFTLNKLECSKRASTRLDTLAWDNRIGLGFYFRWFLGPK
jgi:hypothetical protein